MVFCSLPVLGLRADQHTAHLTLAVFALSLWHVVLWKRPRPRGPRYTKVLWYPVEPQRKQMQPEQDQELGNRNHGF